MYPISTVPGSVLPIKYVMCSTNFYLRYLIYLFLVIQTHETSPVQDTQECNEIVEIFPPNTLILNSTTELPFDTTTEYYVVREGIPEFSISCSSPFPVQWKTFQTKVYTEVKENFAVETLTERIDGEITNILCYSSRITFSDINENLTGVYYCAFSNERPRSINHFPSIYIYGGTGLESGFFINRGQQYTIQTAAYDDRRDLFKDFTIPCKTNLPSSLPIEIIVTATYGKIKIPAIKCSTGNVPCVDLQKIKYENGTVVSLHEGFNLSCSIKNSTKQNDVATVIVLPSPGFVVHPKETQMSLLVYTNQMLKFICRSSKSVTVRSSANFTFTVENSRAFDRYYTYQSEMKLNVPLSKAYPSSNPIARYSIVVSCVQDQNGRTLHTWSYNLTVYANGAGVTGDAKIKLESRGMYEFACLTTFSSSFNVHYVPCSTYVACQMRAELLSNDSYKIQSIDPDAFEVRFTIPLNRTGMVLCRSYKEDVLAFVYIGIYNQFYVLASEPSDDLYEKTILAYSNETRIFEKDVIEVNCTVPMLLVRGISYWEFKFRNTSESVISPDFLVNKSNSWENNMHMSFAWILVPTIDVIEIVCVSLQYKTMPRIILEEGLFTDYPNTYGDTDLKKVSLPIEVKAKPPVVKSESKLGLILGSSFGILFVITAIMTTVVTLRLRAKSKFIDKLREDEIELFLNGRPELISSNEISNTNAQNAAYDSTKEIDINTLSIDYSTVLGSGEFGIVFKATLSVELNEKLLNVAVKCAKSATPVDYLRSAMQELKVMLFIASHENIVKVIGACTQNLRDHELFVVMEYCVNGSLLNYLRTNSGCFSNQVIRGCVQWELTIDKETPYALTTEMLINWAYQIANGMNYVASLNVIHGDLAIRNVLLDENLTAKICDFGLSKKLYVFTQYVRTPTIPVPWRYLAVESLTFKEFSLASDVWAYGVTLWEMFSLGAVPYPGQEYCSEFIKMLEGGFRLPLPQFSPYDIYSIILNCWNKDPHGRPKFSTIFQQLLSIKSDIESAKAKYSQIMEDRILICFEDNQINLTSAEHDFSSSNKNDYQLCQSSGKKCATVSMEYVTALDVENI